MDSTHLDDLSEGPLSNDLPDLIAVGNVVVEHLNVAAILVVKP